MSHLKSAIRPLLAVALIGLGLVSTSTTVTQVVHATGIPTYAYLSGEAGHYNYVIDDATKTLSATVGPFNSNNNWRCNRMTNVANHAGTKVIQASACQANGVIINVADNTFSNLSFGSTVMAFSNDDQYVYSMGYTRQKTRISDGTNVWQVGNGGGSYGSQTAIATSLDGTKLYVPFQNNPTWKVDVLNTSDGSTVTSITDSSWSYPTWTVVSPVGHKMYVGISGGIAVIDTNTDTIINTFTIGWNSAASPSADGNYLYVASGNNVFKLNATTGAQLDMWAVSTGEGGVAVNPAGTHVYALNNNGAGLSIIEVSTGTITNVTLGSERSRTIVFVQQIPAPSISLSRSSGTANVDNAVSGLYSISNTGGTPTSYSISPSTLAAGLSFSTSTGLITGTPTATRAATTYTITATNAGGSSSDTFSLTVNDPPDAPTPTLSTTTSTADGFTFSISNYSNSYNYAVSATNGSASHSGGNVVVTGLSASGASTVTVSASRTGYRTSSATASGRALDATTTTTSTTTTTIAGGVNSSGSGSGGNGGGGGGSTTTVPKASSTTSTSTTIPAPDAPTAKPGDGVMVIDGVETTATVTRANNRVTVGAGGVNVTFNGIAQDGTIVPLDTDGNLRITGGDSISIDGSGFNANQDVEVWMFSTPVLLGTIKADSNGKVIENIKLPTMLQEGNHRFVVKGTSAAGTDALVALGIIVGYESSGLSTTGKLLIALPIALAIFAGLIIPTTLRRRRRDANSE